MKTICTLFLIQVLATSVFSQCTDSNWYSLGPIGGNITGAYYGGIGRCQSLAIDPVDNQYIYVGSESGGLWKRNEQSNSAAYMNDDHL